MKSTRYYCYILIKPVLSRQILEKCSNIKFHENPSSGSWAVPCGRKDGWTDRLTSDRHDEANSRFSQFANALKNHSFKLNITTAVTCFSLVCWSLSGYRRGADKSLARPTSRCRRTESIVSLERGVCSCGELQDLSCHRGWREACQATRAISTTWRRELSWSFFFPARQGAERNSRHSDRKIRGTCTVICHRQKLGGLV